MTLKLILAWPIASQLFTVTKDSGPKFSQFIYLHCFLLNNDFIWKLNLFRKIYITLSITHSKLWWQMLIPKWCYDCYTYTIFMEWKQNTQNHSLSSIFKCTWLVIDGKWLFCIAASEWVPHNIIIGKQ